MKDLIDITNEQLDSYIDKFSADKKLFKNRVYYLDNTCVWRNSDLHIPFTETIYIEHKGSRICMNKNSYIILRTDRLAEKGKYFETFNKLQEFLGKRDKKRSTHSTLEAAPDFNYRAVLEPALIRLGRRRYYMDRYGNGHEVNGIQPKPPVEEISVEEHRMMKDATLSIPGVARYLEIPIGRARTLARCPGFPIQENSKKVSVSALNSWLQEHRKLSMFSTGELIKHVNGRIKFKKELDDVMNYINEAITEVANDYRLTGVLDYDRLTEIYNDNRLTEVLANNFQTIIEIITV